MTRLPITGARRCSRRGKKTRGKKDRPLASFPVEAISFAGKEAEAPDVASIIEETQRRTRCKWKDFGVLYRSHVNRDDVVQQLAEREIPFSIENMDVSDTPDVRDLFACVAVVVDLGSDASLFRVAALPQFDVDPEQLRTALRAIAKESRDGVWSRSLRCWMELPAAAQCLNPCGRRAMKSTEKRPKPTRRCD